MDTRTSQRSTGDRRATAGDAARHGQPVTRPAAPRTSRHRGLALCLGVAALVLVACADAASDEQPAGSDTTTQTDDGAALDDATAQDAGQDEGQDAGQDPGQDPDPGDGATDAAGGEPADLRSLQAQLDPWAPFGDPPLEVEVPSEVGQAVLFLGDERIEMVTGQCRGGPVIPLGDEPVEDAREMRGVFRFEGGAQDPDSGIGVLFLLTEGTTAEGFDDQVIIRRTHQLDIAFPDLPIPTSIRYLEFPDGSVLDGIEAPNTSWAAGPTIAVTRDGLVTARGTVDRSAAEAITPPIEVAFAARCSEEWVAAMDEVEAVLGG